jgi:hypothetical protein
MELSQGAQQGNITQGSATTGQGYQVQSNAGHPQSKVYISAMIHPVPKSKKEQNIKASKPSNIVTTSHYRVSAMVRPNDQVQQSRLPKESTQTRTRTNGVEGANRRIRHQTSIYGRGQWHKLNIHKDPEGNEHLTGMVEANRLLFSQDSTRKRKPPLGKIELNVFFGDSGNFRREKLEFKVMDWPSQYHAILGRPAFAKFMAVSHYAYLELKIPGPKWVITV